MPGAAPPEPRADPNAHAGGGRHGPRPRQPAAEPGRVTISSGLLFGLLVYQLHTRDKELMARPRRDAVRAAS